MKKSGKEAQVIIEPSGEMVDMAAFISNVLEFTEENVKDDTDQEEKGV